MRGIIGVLLMLMCAASSANGSSGHSTVSHREYARMFATYTTKTILSITTSTTTVAYTCASKIGTNQCSKRRFRKLAAIDLDKDMSKTVNDDILESSLLDTVVPEADDGSDRELRLALTIWSSTTSTFTLTSSSTNTSTTFSLSYYCSIAGINFPPACS